ncbi:MAG: methyltransferase domain-containing protein [Candidatus Zambryskibacteria bacterium]
MYIRPSKNFIFPVLQKELSKIKGKIGLDAASAGMKNRHMFKTDMYIGLDIDRASLKIGLKKYPDSKTIGLHADVANLDTVTGNSIDIVVSTNTLNYLPSQRRLRAIAGLSRITAPEGNFICELSLSADFNEELKLFSNNFNSVKKIYYRNIISCLYERFFERNGHDNLGSHPIAGLLPFRIFSWFLSRFEYLTCSFRSLNRHALLICKNKKTTNQKQEFDFENLQKVSDRFYSLMN